MRAGRAKRSAGTLAAITRHDGARTVPEERYRALTLHADSPDTVLVARNAVRSALTDWDLAGLAEDARLVVSELVGNVVNHAVADERLARPGAPRRIDIRLTKWPKWFFLSVADEDSSPPTFPLGEPFSPQLAHGLPEAVLPDSGRGLLIIHRLVDALWWVPEEAGGKTIFCRFDLGDRCAEGSV
ncbi:ATP-binding protein [Streptomyces syringium]|uniref:ATP-binding protein n=1 Tax=Streptomyces syringium TaxID=76729 RepID=UPI00345258CF